MIVCACVVALLTMHQLFDLLKAAQIRNTPSPFEPALAHEEASKDEQLVRKFKIRVTWNPHFCPDTNKLNSHSERFFSPSTGVFLPALL
jgi:hypothetical protein